MKIPFLRNYRGVTLVEVLATLVILSIIVIILYSIIINSQKQFNMQSEANKQINDITYALKSITKDIRKYPNDITLGNTHISIPMNSNHTKKIEYSYNKELKTIDKNGTPLIFGIKSFKTTTCREALPNCINITIDNGKKSISTEIIVRKGNDSQ